MRRMSNALLIVGIIWSMSAPTPSAQSNTLNPEVLKDGGPVR